MQREIKIPDCLTDEKARKHYANSMNTFYDELDAFYLGKDIRDCQIGRFCEGGVMAAALERALNIQNPDRIRITPGTLPLRVPRS